MPRKPNENYTNAALRVGDADPYPQRRVGEFIGIVVSNAWVNDEYKHVVLKVHEQALKAYAGQMFHLLCPSPDGAEVWMRRPMSVYRVDKAAGQVEFLYKTEGRGTRGMAMLQPGDEFNIAGPLGVGFTLSPPGRTSWCSAAASGSRRSRRCRSSRPRRRRRDRDPERAQRRRRDVEGAVRGARRAHHHGARFRRQQRRRERRADPRRPDRRRARRMRSSPAAPTGC